MLRFRPYKRTDAERIASWITSEEEFYAWSAGKMGEYPLTADSMHAYSESIADDDTCYQMVATNDSKPVGYLIMRYPTENRGLIRFGFVVVDPAVRGQGIGRGMLDLAVSYATDMLKAGRITLGVFTQNDDAVKLYRGAGFAETGHAEAYELKGQVYRAVEMELKTDANVITHVDSEVPEDEKIRAIIDENKLIYALQPIVDASSGEIFGYEALMRADFGVNVSPMTILDYATRKNRLYDVEKLTLFNVMELFAGNRELFAGRKIFINSIPGNQLKKKDYTEFSNRFKEFFDSMVLEITEINEFKDQDLKVLLERSAHDGFELAIDDYGTGYSNTSSLLSYLPNYLKIDRLLIAGINEETKKKHFVKSIVEFAASNGFKTLAEGVETSAELKTVIELGVDYIQGYYTAKPSFEICSEIDPAIKSQIISSSVKGTNQETRRIYTVNGEEELPVMRLALEKYTGMLIGQKEFTLVGNTGYSAEMSVKIKDNTKCRLTIRDVFLESTQQLACIEIGTGSELTLVLEGDNRLNKFGILVPESSKLIIEGAGNLQIRSQGVSSYAIGNLWNSGVGDITWRGTGALDILVEADEGIGIGGGQFKTGSGINLLSGMVRIEPASGRAIAVGAVKGKPRIVISDCKVQLDIKIETGIGIGCFGGTQDTKILHANLNILCAGSHIAAIGGVEAVDGHVDIEESELSILANGQEMYLIGAPAGDLDIGFLDSAINLRGEGNNVLALGTKDLGARIHAKQVICNIKLASGSPVVYGASPDNTTFSGGLQSISVNE